MRNAPHPFKDVDEYIAMQPQEFRTMLEELRHIITKAAPKAEETISYQIPCFKYKYMLVGIGVNKKYCSFYTMSPGLIKNLKTELKDLRLSGATIHFPPQSKLPVALIKKIVKARIRENEERMRVKK